MSDLGVYIEQIASGSWKVSTRKEGPCRFFKAREHALEFGVAAAQSIDGTLFLYEPDGTCVCQANASATSETSLATVCSP
jgi:hypothetical protein